MVGYMVGFCRDGGFGGWVELWGVVGGGEIGMWYIFLVVFRVGVVVWRRVMNICLFV